MQKGNHEKKNEQVELAVASDGYESVDVLTVSMLTLIKNGSWSQGVLFT